MVNVRARRARSDAIGFRYDGGFRSHSLRWSSSIHWHCRWADLRVVCMKGAVYCTAARTVHYIIVEMWRGKEGRVERAVTLGGVNKLALEL